ncbi:hypothetical protein [Glutamicibacter sp. NPDC087344]|uniref:hypothetical protein n=1 Tax=Glutamicibacter sp. NPDC087344 TaxID=3363994 RepID=UPI00381FB6F7
MPERQLEVDNFELPFWSSASSHSIINEDNSENEHADKNVHCGSKTKSDRVAERLINTQKANLTTE